MPSSLYGLSHFILTTTDNSYYNSPVLWTSKMRVKVTLLFSDRAKIWTQESIHLLSITWVKTNLTLWPEISRTPSVAFENMHAFNLFTQYAPEKLKRKTNKNIPRAQDTSTVLSMCLAHGRPETNICQMSGWMNETIAEGDLNFKCTKISVWRGPQGSQTEYLVWSSLFKVTYKKGC